LVIHCCRVWRPLAHSTTHAIYINEPRIFSEISYKNRSNLVHFPATKFLRRAMFFRAIP
jgi:hypothetical protein